MRKLNHKWYLELDLYLLLVGSIANFSLVSTLSTNCLKAVSIVATLLTTIGGLRAVIKSTAIVFKFNTGDEYPVIDGYKKVSIPASAHGKGAWPTFKFTDEDGELIFASQILKSNGTIDFIIPKEIAIKVTAIIK